MKLGHPALANNEINTMQKSGSRAPLGDKTNTTKNADAKDHKREKDRARWHAMSQEQKDEKNKRRRESYHNKKNKHQVTEATNDDDVASNKENMDPAETNDWLHRNDLYDPYNIVDGSNTIYTE
ncbi:uncharacterized protein LOC8066275 isoform X2 [Sorghum bicolor]|uniref:uncharacterized protein LOC8066275 isoform X2 n=1 Tax=Sorghum bicolor TaxID=4558 RepID=UPI000B425D44|nr:uncharacterized protein LOC8066275 isoform X2 [Sorghum bicolor]|eukprot:XP_021307444.1 uncharacterized protein LOC8066275 isoform X2 [Sorghum bicolor]